MRFKEILVFSLIFTLGGCASLNAESVDSASQAEIDTSNSNSQNQDENTGTDSPSGGVESPWKCDTQTDALGTEATFCTSTLEDKANGLFWTLGFLCSFDRFTGHSITAMSTYTADSLLWPSGNVEADVRIDDGDIETWRMESISDGEGLFYANSNNRNKSTWNFLSRISSAKTLAIRARTAEGTFASAKFDVADSVIFAARFNVMGCNSSSG